MTLISTIYNALKKQTIFDLLLASALIVISITVNHFQLLQRWDNLVYDYALTDVKTESDKEIIILHIDEESLEKLGRWPWSRAIHARLLNLLSQEQVAAVGLDILFMEADLAHPEDDVLLANAIQSSGNVVLPVLTDQSENNLVTTKFFQNLSESAFLSHVNMHFDKQGIVRQLDLEIELEQGTKLPALALQLYRIAYRDNEYFKDFSQKNIFVTFTQSPNRFKEFSYLKALQDGNLRRTFKDKIILVGMTAAGLSNNISTPITGSQRLMSGVEFHAHALATLQSGGGITEIAKGLCILLSSFFIITPIVSYRFLPPGISFLTAVGFSIFSIGASFSLLSLFQTWFAPMSTFLCAILSYPLWSLNRFSQLNHSLLKEQENANTILKAIDDAVILTNNDGYIEYINPAAETMLGYTNREATSLPFEEVCRLDKDKQRQLKQQAFLYESHHDAHVLNNKTGEERFVRISSNPVLNKQGKPLGLVYALHDLTKLIHSHQKIAFIAAHDALTGMVNRNVLIDLLENTINQAKRKKNTFALLFIDLDGFKSINDNMGHACGDQLLKDISQRLKQCVRQADTLSRWGGDEFIVILDDLNQTSDVINVVKKIQECIAKPIQLKNKTLSISASIGVSLFPEDGSKSDVLIAKADAAMYSAKNKGGKTYLFYAHDLEY